MSYYRFSEALNGVTKRTIKTRWIGVLVLAIFMSLAMKPAQAQNSDTWKSVAIIGGTTAAGAYIGHKIGGQTGMWVGAGAGAAAGYAIDKRRRDNAYYNNQYAYGDTGYYGPAGPDYRNGGGYYPGPYDGPASYPAGYVNSNNSNCRSNRFTRRP